MIGTIVYMVWIFMGLDEAEAEYRAKKPTEGLTRKRDKLECILLLLSLILLLISIGKFVFLISTILWIWVLFRVNIIFVW